MANASITFPLLEACMNSVVTIYSSTPEGEQVIEGKILAGEFPWNINVQIGEIVGAQWTVISGQTLTFAGYGAGIKRIEKDKKVLYENRNIPIPYPFFSSVKPDGLDALNALRMDCFGKGYDYQRSLREYPPGLF